MGNALVTNNQGKAFMKVANTLSDPVTTQMPKVTLQEYYEQQKNYKKEKINLKTEDSIRKILNSFIIPENNSYENNTVFKISKMEREEKMLDLFRLDQLNSEELIHVELLISKHSHMFHLPGEPFTATNVLQHKIPTTDEQPIFTRQYRFPPVHKEELLEQTDELLKNKIIKPSQSPYNTPVWIVPKKDDSQENKKWRMVLDFRKLNEKTVTDFFPLTNIQETLETLGNAEYFSVFYLASGFHQIKMSPEDSLKTAFSAPYGHYEFDRMPFGLKNAPSCFQRLMNSCLSGLIGTELFVYLDDVVIFANTLEEHLNKFDNLRQRLHHANLKLQPDKCEFLRTEVIYLGHIIDKDGVRPDPKKTMAVKNIKKIPGLSRILSPIY